MKPRPGRFKFLGLLPRAQSLLQSLCLALGVSPGGARLEEAETCFELPALTVRWGEGTAQLPLRVAGLSH